MKEKKKIIITSILIILWMIAVFYLSNQKAEESSQLSGGITLTILKILNLTEKQTVEQQLILGNIIRKLAHFLLYTFGGILIMLHINCYPINKHKKILLSWIIGTFYAITDEIHQLFVLGRSGEIRDVCIDSFGVITGIIILLLVLKIIEKIRKNIVSKKAS